MGTISFPDVSEEIHSELGYDTWVLYHEGRNQFYGWVNRNVNYGWTNNPEVTVMGSTCVTPITKSYAQMLLREVMTYRSFDKEMQELAVRKVRMSRIPTDRNRYTWAWAS